LRNRSVQRVTLGVVAVFVAANGIVFVAYRQKTYPKTRVGNENVGSIGFGALADKITGLSLLPAEVAVTINDKTEAINLGKAGVKTDSEKIEQYVRTDRSWLPLVDVLTAHQAPVLVSTDMAKIDGELARLKSAHQRAATNARIVLKATAFSVQEHKNGFELDAPGAKKAFLTAIKKAQTSTTLPIKTLEPKHSSASLAPALQDLQAQQKTTFTYTFSGHTRSLSAAEVTAWFEPKGITYQLSDAKIRNSLIGIGTGWGIGVKNLKQGVAETKKALQAKKALNFALERAPLKQKTFTYCTAARGVQKSHLTGLISKLAAVFADSRGWGLSGQVVLRRVSSGCDFTVWLSTASQMPTFGAICDADWSCRVGPNVVINFDRWQGASTAWNKNGGSLDDYRSMVINHETGHWFEFGHVNCGGSGQLAPVMQQQSIDLQGCKFNPWPLASERAALKRSLAL